MTKQEETEIFGSPVKPMTREQLETIERREMQSHAEMLAFFESLPTWVSDGDMFRLWCSTDKERRQWLEEHNPEPYLKETVERKIISIGGVPV